MIPPVMAGHKQRTRRVINPASQEDSALMINILAGADVDRCKEELLRTSCPFEVGDILYVREEHLAFGRWQPQGLTAGGRPKWVFKTLGAHYFPDEPGVKDLVIRRLSYRKEGWYKRLGRFMPKNYARTFLKVTDRRIECLQDITDAEAVLEGVAGGPITGWRCYTTGLNTCKMPRTSFITLIDKLHGAGTFKLNPLVWVFEFEKTTRPVNFLT